MIGQISNIRTIQNWVAQDKVPQFIVIIGAKGSGRTMLTYFLATNLVTPVVTCGIKVDEVREVIDTASHTRGLYYFKDADTMSVNAKNALLKIVEEPPKDTYFVISLQDDTTLLDTLRSRAYVMAMQPYTVAELQKYKGGLPQLYYLIAHTPGEIDLLETYGNDFFSYVELVLANIREVEPANAFKSGTKLALKSDEGYPLDLFFRTIIHLCMEANGRGSSKSVSPENMCIAVLTSSYLSNIKIGCNRQQLYDMWVLEVRQIETT